MTKRKVARILVGVLFCMVLAVIIFMAIRNPVFLIFLGGGVLLWFAITFVIDHVNDEETK